MKKKTCKNWFDSIENVVKADWEKDGGREREAFGIVGNNTILSIIFVLIQIS